MNRIVRDHYPVSKLPEDLRQGFGPDEDVRITIEAPRPEAREDTDAGEGHFSRFRHLAKARFTSIDEVNQHVAALREEWDHRDR